MYVDSEKSYEDLKKQVSIVINGKTLKGYVVSEFMEIDFTINDDFDSSKVNLDDGFLYYAYKLYISGGYVLKDDFSNYNKERYVDDLIGIILNVREDGDRVVVSCLYEDLIAERTGWNWTASNPIHP